MSDSPARASLGGEQEGTQDQNRRTEQQGSWLLSSPDLQSGVRNDVMTSPLQDSGSEDDPEDEGKPNLLQKGREAVRLPDRQSTRGRKSEVERKKFTGCMLQPSVPGKAVAEEKTRPTQTGKWRGRLRVQPKPRSVWSPRMENPQQGEM